jgi:cell division septal protein FtsQ
MFNKRRTSQARQHSRMKRLEVRVMSPRIAWFGCLRTLRKGAKFAVVLALAGVAGWGAWLGVQRALLDNPEFRLQVIDLNPNDALDERELVAITGLDVQANLFKIDTGKIRERLLARAELSSVAVERHLPGTLIVRVTARQPVAWVALADAPVSRNQGELVVDATGVAFPCATRQWEAARQLPVIRLPKREGESLVAGQTVRQPELARCLRLLDAVCGTDPMSARAIESIAQANAWALDLTTRTGTVATFGLDDHERQVADLAAALDHASRQGYSIATINLIPQRNIPITTRTETFPPRATPVSEPVPVQRREDRRSQDLKAILNRG